MPDGGRSEDPRSCPSCGAQAAAGASFCVTCGQSLLIKSEQAGRTVDRPLAPRGFTTAERIERRRGLVVDVLSVLLVVAAGVIFGVPQFRHDVLGKAQPSHSRQASSPTTTLPTNPAIYWENTCSKANSTNGWTWGTRATNTQMHVTVCGYTFADTDPAGYSSPAGQIFMYLVLYATGSGYFDDGYLDLGIVNSASKNWISLSSWATVYDLDENGNLTVAVYSYVQSGLPMYYVVSVPVPWSYMSHEVELIGNPGGAGGGTQWVSTTLGVGEQNTQWPLALP